MVEIEAVLVELCLLLVVSCCCVVLLLELDRDLLCVQHFRVRFGLQAASIVFLDSTGELTDLCRIQGFAMGPKI